MILQSAVDVLCEISEKYDDLISESLKAIFINHRQVVLDRFCAFVSDYERIAKLRPSWFVGFSVNLVYEDVVEGRLKISQKGDVLFVDEFHVEGRLPSVVTDTQLESIFEDLRNCPEEGIPTNGFAARLSSLDHDSKTGFSLTLNLQIQKKPIQDELNKYLIDKDEVGIIFFSRFSPFREQIAHSNALWAGHLTDSSSCLVLIIGGFDKDAQGPSTLVLNSSSLKTHIDVVYEFWETHEQLTELRDIMSEITKYGTGVYPTLPTAFQMKRASGGDGEIIQKLMLPLALRGILEMLSTSVTKHDDDSVLLTLSESGVFSGKLKVDNGKVLVDGVDITEYAEGLTAILEWIERDLRSERVQIARTSAAHRSTSYLEIVQEADDVLAGAKSLFQIHISELTSVSVDMHHKFIESVHALSSSSADYLSDLESDLRSSILGTLALIAAGVVGWLSDVTDAALLGVVLLTVPLLIMANLLLGYRGISETQQIYHAYYEQHEKFMKYYTKYVPKSQDYSLVEDFEPKAFDNRVSRYRRWIAILIATSLSVWLLLGVMAIVGPVVFQWISSLLVSVA